MSDADEVDRILTVMTRAWGEAERWEKSRRFAALHADVGAAIVGPLGSAGPRDVADALVRLGWTAETFADALGVRSRGSSSGNRRRAGRRRTGSSVVPDNDTSALVGSPYDDPSRDVGDGPDDLTRTQGIILLVGVLLGVYLLSATCGTAVVTDQPPPARHCHTCEE